MKLVNASDSVVLVCWTEFDTWIMVMFVDGHSSWSSVLHLSANSEKLVNLWIKRIRYFSKNYIQLVYYEIHNNLYIMRTGLATK